jgi:hypothetical protein
MASTTTATTTPARSPFLDILPTELRVHIFTHLLVTDTPLQGRVARQNTKYGLHTAILRTNKQIHEEARSIFFGKNTFSITSVPPAPSPTNNGIEEEGSGAFEPPLQLKDLPLVRHLEIDLLYYPRTVRTVTNLNTGSWTPFSIGAQRYITSVSYVLGAVKSSLLTLRFCADVRRYADILLAPATTIAATSSVPVDAEEDEEEEVDLEKDTLDPKRILTGFLTADTNPRFKAALAKLPLHSIPLHFDFPESYFDFVVDMDVLCQQSLGDLVGQVLVKRGEIRSIAALQELGEGDVVEEGTVSLIPQ